MEKLWFGLALGVLVASFVLVGLAVARAGGLGNAVRGLTIAGRAAADPAFAARASTLLDLPLDSDAAPPPVPLPPRLTTTPAGPKPAGGDALQLLALLQTEARLVDFLMEDIAGAADAQIGQAVKEIHKKARQVLLDHLTLGEILAGADGDAVTVPAGFDPAAVRVVGNVTGTPPFTGTLQHPGWKVREVRLPAAAAGGDPMVLQPAEVVLE